MNWLKTEWKGLKLHDGAETKTHSASVDKHLFNGSSGGRRLWELRGLMCLFLNSCFISCFPFSPEGFLFIFCHLPLWNCRSAADGLWSNTVMEWLLKIFVSLLRTEETLRFILRAFLQKRHQCLLSVFCSPASCFCSFFRHSGSEARAATCEWILIQFGS